MHLKATPKYGNFLWDFKIKQQNIKVLMFLLKKQFCRDSIQFQDKNSINRGKTKSFNACLILNCQNEHMNFYPPSTNFTSFISFCKHEILKRTTLMLVKKIS
jgi:hypothetical protein